MLIEISVQFDCWSAFLEVSSVALKDRHRRKTTNEGKNTTKIEVTLKSPKKNTTCRQRNPTFRLI